jgi:hypothetical protein
LAAEVERERDQKEVTRMDTSRIGKRFRARSGILCAAFLAAVPAIGFAAGDPAAAAQRVQVFPDHYAAGGKRFASLDHLDQWVRASGARSLEFHSCMGSANEQLAAAIERLKYVYLDVRWTAAGKSGCPAAAREKTGAMQ